MVNILIIGAVWPEPNSSAAGSRMMQLITLFKQAGWRVTFATTAAPSAHAIELADYSVETAAIALNDPSFDHFVQTVAPDVVLFDRYMTEEQFGWRVAEQCPNAMRILNTEDLHSVRKARHNMAKSTAEWCAPLAGSAQLHTDLAKREVAAILRCDLSIIISEAEMALLTDTFQLSPHLLHYTPLMMVDGRKRDDALPYASRRHFATIGNFRHAPNWDGVLQLKEVIWPLIKAQLPDAELHIYGAYPPPKATALHNKRDRFLVRGWVDDAVAALRSVRICLAPLRFGAGLKGKLMLSMACGTPSVTTPIGAEGLQGDLAWGGGIAADPAAFAAAAVALYNSETAWLDAQANGYAILNKRFDGADHGPKLLARIESVRAELAHHRASNFMGALLHHHTLQSTKYLARWIEAKNKKG